MKQTLKMRLGSLSPAKRYALSALAASIAICAQYIILNFGKLSGLGFIYPVSFLIAWFLGFGPSVFGILLSAIGADLFCYLPSYSLFNRSADILIRLGIFILTAIFVAWVIERGKKLEQKYFDAEDRSHSSEAQLQLIANRLPAFVSYMDIDRRYRFVNKTYSEWFGKTPEEIQGKTREELVNDPNIYEEMHPHQEKAYSGETSSYELTLRNSDGEIRHLDVEYLPDRDPKSGKVRGIIGVGHDVTLRKIAQRESEIARQELFDLFMQVPIGIAMIEGRDFTFTLANETFQKMLFGGLREIIGMKVTEVFPDEADLNIYLRILNQVFDSDQAFVGKETPFMVRENSGTIRQLYLNFVYHPKHNWQGKVDGVIAIFYDVTELVTSRQKLEEAVRARDEFLSIASHELKTPLSSLKLQIQLHQRYLKKGDLTILHPEKMGVFLEKSSRQILRLDRLIEDMLDVSRIQGNRLTIELEKFNLSVLVTETVERMQNEFTNARCAVETKLQADTWVNADRFRIEQVIINLLSNSIKYGPGKPITIETCTENANTILSVKDNGVGIDPAIHERIFQRFERAHSARNISGLGLGLYIVKTILEQHSGDIRVESIPSVGATFIVTIPTEGKITPLT